MLGSESVTAEGIWRCIAVKQWTSVGDDDNSSDKFRPTVLSHFQIHSLHNKSNVFICLITTTQLWFAV